MCAFPKDINYPRIGKWAQFCNSFGHINSPILSWLGSDLFCDISISIFKRTFWYDFLCNFARNGSWKNINIQASLIHFWFLLFTLQQVTTERGIDSYHQLEKRSFDMQSLSSLIPLIALFTVVENHKKSLIWLLKWNLQRNLWILAPKWSKIAMQPLYSNVKFWRENSNVWIYK